MSKRPPGLVAVIVYKAVTAVLLVVASISLLLTLEYQPGLEQFSRSLTLAGKRGMIAWVLDKILNSAYCSLQTVQP